MPMGYFSFLGRVLQNRERTWKKKKKKKDSQEEICGWAYIEFMKVGECKIKETDQGPRSKLGAEGREMVLERSQCGKKIYRK